MPRGDVKGTSGMLVLGKHLRWAGSPVVSDLLPGKNAFLHKEFLDYSISVH